MKLGPSPRSMPVADAVARNVNTRSDSDRHKQCENRSVAMRLRDG